MRGSNPNSPAGQIQLPSQEKVMQNFRQRQQKTTKGEAL